MGLGAAALVIGGIGTAISAYGAVASGNAASANANYQAQVARNDSITANQNAEYTEQAGATKAEAASLKSRDRLEKVRTGIAANGIDVNSGSAADAQVTQREMGTLDTETTVNNADLQAYGYRTQSTNFTAQAGLDQAESSQASTAGYISAGGGLLSSVSSLGTNYAKLQQVS